MLRFPKLLQAALAAALLLSAGLVGLACEEEEEGAATATPKATPAASPKASPTATPR
ncbi:MAG: hypothetical protein Q8P22_11850 [Chloroflexota bacterium]|nr:hypothetical protein [Chloroflexota bacterium]